MRTNLIAGNWKMNLDRAGSVELATAIASADLATGVHVIVCPPYVYLDAVREVIRGSSVRLGAQDVFFASNGAYTGEISVAMLQDVGCEYVIIGHSERRHALGEQDTLINKKVHAALDTGLIPIVCVGERLVEREAGQTKSVVRSQFDGSLAGLNAQQIGSVVISYEPVWAIGTGKTATPDQAQEVHADLRNLVASRYNPGVSQQVRILYGGSVKPSNAGELLSQPDIDGALVGGASLVGADFLGIIAAARGRTPP
jgi:triosephosphate isomerase